MSEEGGAATGRVRIILGVILALAAGFLLYRSNTLGVEKAEITVELPKEAAPKAGVPDPAE